MPSRPLPRFLVALALSLPPAAARAEAPRSPAADALFRDARKLMLAGKLEAACPKFLAAQKLDPTVGTALNIGECFERAGKTASAWAGFDEARALARRQGDELRAAEAERRAKKIEPRLSRVLLQAPAGGLPPGSVIQIDGQAIDAAAVGTAIPVDPGPHAVELAAPGGRWTAVVTALPGPVTVTVEIALPAAPLAPRAPEPPPPPPPVPFWGAQRIAGTAVGVAGVAALVAGAAFGMKALARKNQSNDGPCDARNLCDAEGKRLRAEAMRAGDASTALFIGGGAALAGGLTLFFTAPSRARASTALVIGPGEARLEGRW